jgi:enoyl-CoA hydratase/carnithine racemase
LPGGSLAAKETNVYEEILYDVTDPVATITLNRPDVLNAWTPRMGAELRHAFGRAERDKRVVGIVLTGAGRGFCAGADLGVLASIGGNGTLGESSFEEGLPPELRHAHAGDESWGEDLRGPQIYMLSVPKPVIVAINGAVAGMGVPVALAGDLRFMAVDAVLTMAFSQRGLIAEWGVSWLLPRLVGPAVALDLLFSSRKIDGREAEHLGVVNRALPVDEVVPAAVSYIEGLASTCSPWSLSIIKRQVYQQLHDGLGRAELEARRLMLESFSRADFKEGIESFVQHRPPVFGRIGDDPQAD